MSGESVITQQMLDAVDVESEPVTHEVEKGAIIRFAQAIGDPSPIYNDERAARSTRYGGLVAPPTFLRSMMSGPEKALLGPYGPPFPVLVNASHNRSNPSIH